MKRIETVVMVSVIAPTVLILAIPLGLGEQQQAVAASSQYMMKKDTVLAENAVGPTGFPKDYAIQYSRFFL